ncbi:MAG: hypothetical protein BWY57_03285 [Betaproteobacteria bacterium ADurb.Bin341]|nr:MAG: hypothetical protein BWY57_03285 [Betaproteobacteria bacterium ADurb.Bin341]
MGCAACVGSPWLDVALWRVGLAWTGVGLGLGFLRVQGVWAWFLPHDFLSHFGRRLTVNSNDAPHTWQYVWSVTAIRSWPPAFS